MNVTQCDVCGNVVKHEQSVYLKANKTTADNKIGSTLKDVELCQVCWDKVVRILDNQKGR